MSWIKTERSERPEQGKFYWITAMYGGAPKTVLAKWGKKYWSYESGERVRAKVLAWWDRATFVPRPYVPAETTRKFVFPPYETDEFGNNVKITARELPEEEMRRIGFTDYDPKRWRFSRKLKCVENVEFSLTMDKGDPSTRRLDVLDENFCQPYDYQATLERNAGNETARKVMEEVEGIMAYLAGKGILSGHERGDYV